MNRGMVWLALAAVVLAFLFGVVLVGRVPDLTDAQAERARIENAARAEKLAVEVEQKRALVGWTVAGKVAGGALAIVGAAGFGLAALRWLNRRAAEIRPNDAGVFPVVRVRVNGSEVLHDPNRALAATTVYTSDEMSGAVQVVPVVTGDLAAQERTTARAQAVQLAAAVHRHPPGPAPGGGRGRGSVGFQDPGNADVPDLLAAAVEWPARVPLRGLLDNGTSLGRLVLGVTIDPETGQRSVVTGDMSKLVHVAVGGSAGWGKSVFLQSLAYQLATCPERPDLAMVDLDGTTLTPFADSDRLLYPIADSETDALAVFNALAGELEKRKALYSQVPGAYDLRSYNAQAGDQLSPVVLVCDEATALLGDKGVEQALRTLALRGRKFGLWAVLAGQDWKATSLDTAIRNQLSTRLQFKALSASQSRVLLQQRGAESLPVPGRALAVLPGQDMTELQAPTVAYDDIVAALTGQAGAQHDLPTVETETAQVVESANETGLTVDQVEQARDLWAQGQSFSAIAEQVFGYRNARKVDQVRAACESDDW